MKLATCDLIEILYLSTYLNMKKNSMICNCIVVVALFFPLELAECLEDLLCMLSKAAWESEGMRFLLCKQTWCTVPSKLQVN